MSLTRREFGKLTLAAVPAVLVSNRVALAAAKIDSRVKGIQIGAITYSFTSLPNPQAIIDAYVSIGLGLMELMSNHCEALAGAPAPAGRGGRGAAQTPEQQAAAAAALKARTDWRMSATPATFTPVRRKIADAGIDLKMLCYNMNVRTTTDDEIEYAFTMAKGLGVELITTSTQVSMAKRLKPFAEKHKIRMGFHGHDSIQEPDEVHNEASFEQVFAVSDYFGANLDIGHYIVAKGDPVAFLTKHRARVTSLHLKDKKKDGVNVAWGQGDTPITSVLKLIEKTKWDLPTNIEYVYVDPDGAVAGVTKCFNYIKAALA